MKKWLTKLDEDVTYGDLGYQAIFDVFPKYDAKEVVDSLPHDTRDIKYVRNQYGYRTKFNNQPLMTLGCSYTFGQGLPNELVWPNLLSKKIKKDVVNLGFGGDSAMGQVRRAFWYFKNFGHPEAIVCVFPLFRMPLLHIPGRNEYERVKGMPTLYPNKIRIQNYSFDNPGSFTNFAKIPYSLDSVMDQDISFFYTVMAIELLEQYCESHNIKLITSVWGIVSEKEYYLYQLLNYRLKSFIMTDVATWRNHKDGKMIDGDGNDFTCHREYSNNDLFHYAVDREPSKSSQTGWISHWGIHAGLHLAEQFSKQLIDLEYISEDDIVDVIL